MTPTTLGLHPCLQLGLHLGSLSFWPHGVQFVSIFECESLHLPKLSGSILFLMQLVISLFSRSPLPSQRRSTYRYSHSCPPTIETKVVKCHQVLVLFSFSELHHTLSHLPRGSLSLWSPSVPRQEHRAGQARCQSDAAACIYPGPRHTAHWEY